ncbi:AraC family transcriptional regulator [Chryseobacterium sp. T16E-39]|uniref:AraC family transcriptional regulator n=1 Tax=Chryseobacterium sp. T16E-39 TaxID=2015076 RepID=UPI000B5B0DCA|nr:AraC family transcriptional regulator [Chryseobacterium sp. T16E-39]ASK30440.1 AraC family transcriptional regulator [Chryseobacterium sp. T16E-39]
MKTDNLYAPYELAITDMIDECPRGIHTHTFFEFVYVIKGAGVQNINGDQFSYEPGHLFLLAPQDNHTFEIKSTSRFFFIRFNATYLKTNTAAKGLVNRLEMILRNISSQSGCILKRENDKQVIESLMHFIINEHMRQDLFHKEVVDQYINTLLVIVSRNISITLPDGIDENSDSKVLDILNYIQQNISSPDKIKAEHIGNTFGVAEAYLGRYFKHHTGERLQNYILNYKFKQVENRLLHSDMRISEIADEFGFTDKSHLSKAFKKHTGVNPTEFRKNYLEAAKTH